MAKADEEFFERSRKLSPKFPSVTEAVERRRRWWENVLARLLLLMLVLGAVYSLWTHDVRGWITAGIAFICFVGVVVVACARAHGANRVVP